MTTVSLGEVSFEAGGHLLLAHAVRQHRPGDTITVLGGDFGLLVLLQAWCRESLAGYKCPKQIRFVGEISRNPMGKIDKRALRATLL